MATVIEALRRFLPEYLREHPGQDRARRRAIWALTHCRTPAMGGHVRACTRCGGGGTHEFAWHSCNHRACPQCGRAATAQWVERELEKRVEAPYFMVTFTLPQELRALFFTALAKPCYDLFFTAASEALGESMADPRELGARCSGLTMVLHTWNQRLHFHPHLHGIVPGAGINAAGRVVSVKRPKYLVSQPELCARFRDRFRQKLAELTATHPHEAWPVIAPEVWEMHWGVYLQPFGDGRNAIKYLGTYVCRTAIGDARLVAVDDRNVRFRWKDRAHGNVQRVETVSGVEFVARYLRHVLPEGLRAIRRYGFCHPAAKVKRERVAFQTGRPLHIGPVAPPPPPKPERVCACCGAPMQVVLRILPSWRTPAKASGTASGKSGRAPPAHPQRAA